MFKMSLSSRLGYRASLPSRRFRRVRHLAEKRLLTLGYSPLTGRPFFAPPWAVHEYTDARFREPAFAPDFAEATSGEKATAGRAEFAGATVARDPVLLRLAAPNYKGHTSPGISGGLARCAKYGLALRSPELAKGEVWAGVDSNH